MKGLKRLKFKKDRAFAADLVVMLKYSVSQALDKSESMRDGGFTNHWSFDHSEESEGDAEKDEARLLSIDESDGSCSPRDEKKSLRCRPGTIGTRGDHIRTYTRRGKVEGPRIFKGNAIGLNMLGSSKKLSENAQTISCPGTVVHGRIFQHAHAQTPVVKTAAQRVSHGLGNSSEVSFPLKLKCFLMVSKYHMKKEA
uniref:Uncharacterized protein n=1 Tax=Sphaerodactylus townsendi TaxID=933632 RepID=A0ACB8GCZ5_9SAUR